MGNLFDNPLVRDIERMMQEQATPSYFLEVGGRNARTLDFSEDIDDPSVTLFGYGTMRVSTLKKDIQRDLTVFANQVNVRDAKDLMVYMTDFDGKKSSNMYFAYKLQALMEIQEFMKKPEVKRKITLMKKSKTGR